MTPPIIKKPLNEKITGENSSTSLIWALFFQPKWQGQYTAAQKFADSEILRYSEPYIPLLQGVLIQSGILGTVIGSGLVQWIAPYAKPQYYATRAPGSQTGALRGPYWFQRMKEVRGRTIIQGARKIAGTGRR